MSVQSCNRKGCLNILCDRYSQRYGYICNDCFSELLESTDPPDVFMNTDKYSREYFFITYSKTGKLKVYTITISVDIDKPNADDPQLLVEYSFEDMLKRSQRSLDSFVASDEDF